MIEFKQGLYILTNFIRYSNKHNQKIMGGQFCHSGPTGGGELLTSSGIYLSNPQSISKTQIRASGGKPISQSASQFIDLESTSLILGCKQRQHRQLLNKYMLTYFHFLKSKTTYPELEIKDFTKLMNILDEDKKFTQEIQLFQSQYLKMINPRQKYDFLIKEYFKNGFFSSAIEKFPIYSSDPSIIGYARRPLVDLNKGIKSRYEKQQKKKQIYCVLQVQKQEQALLNKMSKQQDYFTFGTFIRCFSSQDKAKKRQKQLQKIGKSLKDTNSQKPSTLFLNIQIPNEEVDKDYDYGFYQEQSQKQNPLGDIIMNILNFFQVTNAEPQEKTYDLKYNGLSRIIHLSRARLLSTEPQLLKVTTLIEGQCEEINSHSSLLRAVMDRRLSITASQSLKKAVNLNQKTQDNERINLIEAYIEEKEFDKALQECKETLQFKVRKAQVYYEANKLEQAESIFKQIQPQKQTLKKDFFKEYILYEFISAKIKKSKGQKNAAQKQLRRLSEAMKKQYRGAYEFRGRQVQREIADCEGVNESGVDWQKYGDGLNLPVMLSH